MLCYTPLVRHLLHARPGCLKGDFQMQEKCQGFELLFVFSISEHHKNIQLYTAVYFLKRRYGLI